MAFTRSQHEAQVGSVRRVADPPLRAGDVVDVRTPAEILATLDGEASAEGMPFMPEMLQHCGRRFTVTSRVEKICDTVSGGPPSSRRVRDTVLLDDLRCDGAAHGGCQAGCRFYWREAWLRKVEPVDGAALEPSSRSDPGDALATLEQLAHAATRVVREGDAGPAEAYRCQATEAVRATEPMSNFDLRQYGRELRSGNVRFFQLLIVAARGLRTLVGRKLHLVSYRPLPRPSEETAHRDALNLRPGEVVEVRPPEEIAPTIDERGKTRGLWFDWEMVPYCGGRYRVRDRVERLIDERNGEMIEIASDCLILDGVVCTGECSAGHWLCPRGTYPYWREDWLRRVDGDGPSSNGNAPHSG